MSRGVGPRVGAGLSCRVWTLLIPVIICQGGLFGNILKDCIIQVCVLPGVFRNTIGWTWDVSA